VPAVNIFETMTINARDDSFCIDAKHQAPREEDTPDVLFRAPGRSGIGQFLELLGPAHRAGN
jgi:hypothetical protein